MKSKPITARLFIEKHSVPTYFTVFYHTSIKTFCKARNQKPKDINAAAYFKTTNALLVKVDENGKESKYQPQQIGELHFRKDYMTFCTIAHELYHAVQSWNGEVGHNVNSDEDEERSAKLMGNLMSQMLEFIQEKLKGTITSYTVKPNKGYKL